MKIKFLTASLLICINISYAGIKEVGNGGDSCENKIQNILTDFHSWLISEQFNGIVLPNGIKPIEYQSKMLEGINISVISCSSEKLYIKNAEKTCINSIDELTNQGKIICNYDRFLNAPVNEQYKLIHHEIAGIAGFEKNNDSEKSDYTISNQIEDFLSYKTVLVLGPLNNSVKTFSLKELMQDCRHHKKIFNNCLPQPFIPSYENWSPSNTNNVDLNFAERLKWPKYIEHFKNSSNGICIQKGFKSASNYIISKLRNNSIAINFPELSPYKTESKRRTIFTKKVHYKFFHTYIVGYDEITQKYHNYALDEMNKYYSVVDEEETFFIPVFSSITCIR